MQSAHPSSSALTGTGLAPAPRSGIAGGLGVQHPVRWQWARPSQSAATVTRWRPALCSAWSNGVPTTGLLSPPRPDLIRGPVFLGCGPISCPGDEVQWRVRLSLGVEIGWVPGLAATPLGLLAILFAAVASGGSN